MDGNSESYTYDKLGRVSSITRDNISGSKTYVYNTDGVISSVRYPGNENVFYSYDPYGYVTGITSDKKTIHSNYSNTGSDIKWTSIGGMKYWEHYNTQGRLVFKELTDKDGNVLEHHTYFYNSKTGNMIARLSGKEKSTAETMGYYYGGRMPDPSPYIYDWQEYFEYDEMNRLVRAADGIDGITIEYDASGNITRKTDIGNYYYNHPDKPHAVTSTDNNWEVISTFNVGTTFLDNGKIGTISGKESNFYFTYGPDKTKWSVLNTKLTGNCEDEYLFYFDNMVERGVMDDYYSTSTQYFLENDVLLIKDDNGQKSYYQLFRDYLGSICAAYAEDGTKVFEAHYDAWGNPTVTINDINLRYGYTGHEMLPEVGLINMEGRLYDPAIGRFISCDNFVQEPNNSQNFNRYSYCLNNPLRYTDPSGQLFGIDNVVFAAFNMFSSAMMAVANEQNVWKAIGTSALQSALSFGVSQATNSIGGIFGHGAESAGKSLQVGTEIARATAHGVVNGLVNAIQGNNFLSGFACGFGSSIAGSGLQAMDWSSNATVNTTFLVGGLISFATGDGFLSGAMPGITIGLLNHTWIEYSKDSNGNYYGSIKGDELVCYGDLSKVKNPGSVENDMKVWIGSGLSMVGGGVEGFQNMGQNARFGSNSQFYGARQWNFKTMSYSTPRPFYGNQYVETTPIWSPKNLSRATRALTVGSVAFDCFDLVSIGINQGTSPMIHTIPNKFGGWTGAWLGGKAGASLGSYICPGWGTLIGGVVGGFVGGYCGGQLGNQVNTYLNNY